MKQIPVLFLLILLQACVLFKPETSHKKPAYVKVKTPPGTVWLRDSLFIHQHEITNLDYHEFLYWIRRYHYEAYYASLPDTLVWRKITNVPDSFAWYYLRHSTFQDYPLVGVSMAQANAYCDWLTVRVNEMLYLRYTKNGRKLMRNHIWDPVERGVLIPSTLRYRLPTREEWEYAAQSGLKYENYPIGYDSMYRKNGAIVDNLYSHGIISFGVPMPVQSYWKNNYNLYHMLGNVSELTSDSMIKGLNFLTQPNGESFVPGINFQREADTIPNGYTIKSYMKYEKPAAWLGFRCVCEVLK